MNLGSGVKESGYEDTMNRYDPSNMHYYATGGVAVPVKEIPTAVGISPMTPCWDQLAHLEELLADAIAWYSRLVTLGYEGMPGHMRRGIDCWYVALATSYSKIRELKGTVEVYRAALVNVPKQGQMF